jgi:subtilisin-like proprotein convertase family protein
MQQSIVRKLFITTIVILFAGLVLSPLQSRLGDRFNVVYGQTSATSEGVNQARQILEASIRNESGLPGFAISRATEFAFQSYKAIVENRVIALQTTIAEMKKKGSSGSSQIKAMEAEITSLQKSVSDFYQEILKIRNSQGNPAKPSALTASFCNSAAITINTGSLPSTATPYPSTINVSGLTGTITKVTVTLNNYTHPFPDDVDVLLVSPTGESAIIMSDAGGSTCANCPVTLTLDDAAATQLPNSNIPTPLASGTFRPADFTSTPADAWPAPAPTPPAAGSAALSAFNGIDPNGTWSLYVVDDTVANAGAINGGWCLDITAGAGACTLTCPGNVMQAKDANFCGALVSYAAPTTTGSCGTVTCSPPSGAYFPLGATTVTCSETGGQSCMFTVTVTGVCPPGQICNNTAITINDSAMPPTAASAYPSTINVAGLTGIVSKVTVTLANLSHAFPDDVDILLVGPGGQNAILMSDVGGNATNAISPNAPVTLTLDDDAANSLPGTTMLSTGTFKPTNDNGGDGDTFSAPAPAPSGGSLLSVFNGTDPNGTWSLYVVDDGNGSSGLLASGWCLNITTTTPTPCMLTCPGNVTQAKDANFCGALVSYAAPTTTGSCGTVTCSPPSGAYFPLGATTVNCSETGGQSCMFTVTVTGVCPPGQICNNTAITINDSAAPPTAASVYPSIINVTGLTGIVSKVTVTLANLSHAFPDDVDILLVGPGGQNAILMSDVGGNGTNAISPNAPVTLTLDDAAASSLPGTTMLSTGTFKPTNDNGGDGDTFPAPAPAPSGGSLLSVFNGTDPNGTWSLYVVDDGNGSSGLLASGWCLNITVVCGLTCPANITVANDLNQCGAVVKFAPTVTGPCINVTCTPASGTLFPIGTTTVTCSESGGVNCSFTVTVNDTQVPTVNCPANMTVPNTPNSCSAVVTYNVTATDNCPGVSAVTCMPPSGSTFPVGTTMVSCSATDAVGNTGMCSFTVTVQDTQAPTISCPANIMTMIPVGQTCVVVTYANPTVSDNCPGVTFACVPPSGSCFAAGVTTVTCTATDASMNQSSCSFTVSTFDVCLQDDSNPATVLLFNSQTGNYLFCCGVNKFTGTGIVTIKGSTFTLKHDAADRRLTATVSKATNIGSASLQSPPGTVKCSITDRDIRNNSCNCSL